MNFKFNLIFVGFLINLSNGCSSKPLEKPAKPHNPIKAISPIDGVRFSRSETSKMRTNDVRNLHHAFTFGNHTWKGGQVIYEIDEAFSDDEWDALIRAMEEIQNSTCIRYVPFKKDRHHHFVKIRKDFDRPYRDESSIGCLYKGEQPLWFGHGRLHLSDYQYIILHQLLHTLGFFDHHMRSNRDKYIEFKMKNTKFNDSVIASDFVKLVDPDPEVELLTPFDFDSVMMDDAFFLSKNGYAFITPKIKGIKIPSRSSKRHLSKNDKILINKFYNCPVD